MKSKKQKPISSKRINTPLPKDDISFFDKVYQVVRLIPKGRVTSYGAIAAYLGTKGSARMVGWAMNASHNITPKIPAHRVVNRIGLLTGKNHFGSNEEMKAQLLKEKIKVVDDKILNFNKHFWDPVIELVL
jgi:methylated-DNA-protein-cysteine methyltransferase related protein